MSEERIFPKENNSIGHGKRQVESFCLYSGVWSVNLKFPNLVSRNRRLSMPNMGKVLSALSAIFRAPAGIVSCGWRVSIGRPAQRPMFREDSAASLRPGSVVAWSASSFLNP